MEKFSDVAGFGAALYSVAYHKGLQHEMYDQLNILLSEMLMDQKLFALVCMPAVLNLRMGRDRVEAWQRLVARTSLMPILRKALKHIFRIPELSVVDIILAYSNLYRHQHPETPLPILPDHFRTIQTPEGPRDLQALGHFKDEHSEKLIEVITRTRDG